MQQWIDWLDSLETSMGKETVDFWLRSLELKKFDARNLYLQARDSFQLAWFEEHVRARCQKELLNHNGRCITVHINYPAPQEKKQSSKKTSLSTQEEFFFKTDELSPIVNLDLTLQHPGNELPYLALQEIIQNVIHNPQAPSPYNPLYIFGPCGSGKTHLLMAACHKLLEEGVNALYTTAETFTYNVVQAIRKGYMADFRKMYRKVDILFVDDIDEFARKGATQEEFFHTFNTLHTQGKQLILSAELAPSSLKLIQQRLISRFEWGLVSSLQAPGAIDTEKILLKRLEFLKLQLSPAVIRFLVDTFGQNLNDLIEALDKILWSKNSKNQTRLYNTPQSLQEVKNHLSSLILKKKQSQITAEKIIHSVADYYGVTTKDLLGKSQQREYSTPRHAAIYLCRSKLNLPYTKIGDIFQRDHSTIMSGVRNIEKRLKSHDGVLKNDLDLIAKRFTES